MRAALLPIPFRLDLVNLADLDVRECHCRSDKRSFASVLSIDDLFSFANEPPHVARLTFVNAIRATRLSKERRVFVKLRDMIRANYTTNVN